MKYQRLKEQDLELVVGSIADDFQSRGMPGVAAWLRRLGDQCSRANALSDALVDYYMRESRDEIPGSPVEMRKRRALEKAHMNYRGLS